MRLQSLGVAQRHGGGADGAQRGRVAFQDRVRLTEIKHAECPDENRAETGRGST